jgi:hypothetical protein
VHRTMTPRCQSGEVMGGKGYLRQGEAKYPRKEVGLRRMSKREILERGSGSEWAQAHYRAEKREEEDNSPPDCRLIISMPAMD